MPKSAAFFDVDETIITVKSMFDFFAFWCREKGEQERLKVYMSTFNNAVSNGVPRERLNKDYYRQFAGVSYHELMQKGEEWFKYKLKSGIFIGTTVSALKKHQSDQVEPVFISGSMLPILSPVANYLGVKHILGAPLKINDSGKVTGEIGSPQTIGLGKKTALVNFCHEHNINPRDCYAYGDDLSDIPMLESTGNPVCVGSDSALSAYALKNGWLVI